ncbi:hypothetical protein C0Q70_14812 [Pomacea canaliculata]|uniref:Uncharacterized protein n=1 Tax=Pomacea canaliculata TaxID=400727 RepID=A0A2T7NT38_POMCA|nr:hypothetical protein C0Q70_14812 [Pomacea canaliculata]
MGCRPSRRAASCVRVAGEGSWRVREGEACRLGSDAEGSTKLRQRSRRKGSGKKNSTSWARYSAPPGDSQFPPHSCTTATYHDGCWGGTSRITVRLSKNGSTLEIEKCEFQNSDDDDGYRLGGGGGGTGDSLHGHEGNGSVPLRTQSAPDLSGFNLRRDDSSDDWSEQRGRLLPLPPPPPYRLVARWPLAAVEPSPGDGLVSGAGSVRTTASVEVDVEREHDLTLSSSDLGATSGDIPARGLAHNSHQLSGSEVASSSRSRPQSGAMCLVEEEPACEGSVVVRAAAAAAGSSAWQGVTVGSLVSTPKAAELVDLTLCCSGGRSGCMATAGCQVSSSDDVRGVRHPHPHSHLCGSGGSGAGNGVVAGKDSAGHVKMSWCRGGVRGTVSRVASNGSGSCDAQVSDDIDDDSSTDTGCGSDDNGRIGSLSRMEVGPAYVHADFRNGELSLCVRSFTHTYT